MILEYEKRGFDSVPAMDYAMVKMWNKYIKPEDKVIHLGDFALTGRERRQELLSQLNGYKVIIWGNHDPGLNALVRDGFDEAYRWMIADIVDTVLEPDGNITFRRCRALFIHDYCHWAQNTKVPAHLSISIVICGHAHGNWKTKDNRAVNVGVDNWDYKPISFAQAFDAIGAEWLPNESAMLEDITTPKSTGITAFHELYGFEKGERLIF
jgi:calcineurin-like phosphoesterase family protein